MKSTYLRPEDIRALQRLVFTPRTVAEGRMAGRHRSVIAGASTDFRDYRPYTPGDDLRQVDWRVYARTDRHYLRTHNQETDTLCHIFMDCSASMGFGAPQSKLAHASCFAAALAYLVLRSNDAFSLHLFDENPRYSLPPGSTTQHLHALLSALEDNKPAGRTSVAAALQRGFPLLSRKGALVVLSDFFDDPAAIFEALSPYLHRGFRVHLFHLLAPEDQELPDRGLTTFRDLETGERLVAHARALRDTYRAAMDAHVASLRELAVRRRVNYVLTRTDQSILPLFDELAE